MDEVKSSGAFLGVVDLFAVLMPGVLLVGALHAVWPATRLDGWLPSGDSGAWLAVVVEAYVAGHFLFLLSSGLDGLLYHRVWRPLLETDGGLAYRHASALKAQYFGTALGPVDRLNPMNTFAWAKTIMALRAPGALAEVQRFEADSKFFRSLTVLVPILGVIALNSPRTNGCGVPALIAALGLTGLAAWRYAERRYKSTQWAYHYMITLHGAASPAAPSQEPGPPASPGP